MEINNLETELKFVNKMGLTLNIEERMKIEMGINLINDKFNLDEVLVWGKIKGVYNDYYIIQGLKIRGQTDFPSKVYFWANEEFKFGELTECKSDLHSVIKTIRTPFLGHHEKILVKQNSQISKNVTELDRLSYVVRQIENDCSCVPVGAFKITPTGEIRYNDHFTGLQVEQLNNINNYQHFRKPQTQAKQELILRNDALNQMDFMDPMSEDRPKDCWSIQQDSNVTEVILKSLLWPGFLSYHRSNSKVFGRIYIGDGIQTSDMPFII